MRVRLPVPALRRTAGAASNDLPVTAEHDRTRSGPPAPMGRAFDAESVSVTRYHRGDRRAHLCRSIFARAFRATQAARDQRRDPARQVLQEPLAHQSLRAPHMVRTARAKSGAARQSDERLVALYLDMLAAERG